MIEKQLVEPKANQKSKALTAVNNQVQKTTLVAVNELNSSDKKYEFDKGEMSNIENKYSRVKVDLWEYLSIQNDLTAGVEYHIRVKNVLSEVVDLVNFDTKKPICDEDGVQMTERREVVYFFFWNELAKKTEMRKNYAIFFMLGVLGAAKKPEYVHDRGDLMTFIYTGRSGTGSGKQAARFDFDVRRKDK